MPKVGRTHGADPQQSQLQYLFPPSYTAPFGTDNTQKLRMKLVNGKPELIPEDMTFSPRAAPPTPVRNKPLVRRDFNVNNINTYPESLYRRSSRTDQNNSFEDVLGTPIQQGKSLRQRSFSPHKVVPPIRQVDVPEKSLLVRLNRVCNGNYLPSDGAIVYAKEEQLQLKRLVQENFGDFTLDRCQRIYTELTGYDAKISGYVTFSDLDFALIHNQIDVNKDITRLISAQFVGTEDLRNKINYEDFLSYIRAALMEKDVNVLKNEQTNSGVYLNPTAPNERNGIFRNPITSEIEDYSTHSQKYPFGDRENAKLQQTVRTELEDAEELGMWDFETIWQEFRQADREKRGTMSRDQIHQLTFLCRIPLQNSIIDKIIDRACRFNSGQHDWSQYLEFIGKVLPVKTGLTLPQSKKPSEYKKELPAPSSNWPHPSTQNYSSSKNLYPYSSPRKTDYTNPYVTTPRKQNLYDDRGGSKNDNGNYGDTYDRSQSKQSEVEVYDDKLRRLENKYSRDRAQLLNDKQKIAATYTDEPWFKRFIRMTDMLYVYDQSNSGTLPLKTAQDKVMLGNDIHQLGLKDSEIETALQRSKVDNDNVMIDKLVDLLSMNDK